MSASASKKKRKELDAQGLLPSQVAAQKEKEKKAKTVRTVLISVVAVVVALGIVIGVGVLLKDMSYRPNFDVNTAAVTVGEYNVTVPEYNYFYSELASTYANYGLITANTPLADQTCLFSSDQTWEEYLKSSTLDSIKDVYCVYDAAQKEGYTLTEEDEATVSDAIANVKTAARQYGYSNVNYFLSDRMGKGCTLSNYETYLRLRQVVNSYSNAKAEELTPTDEEVDAALAEAPDEYHTVYYKSSTVTAENSAEEGETAEYTDEAKAAAQEEAEALAASFPADAVSRNGVFSSVVSLLDEEAANWLFDSARKEGDTQVFADEDGVTYTVVQFTKLDLNDYRRVIGTVLRIAKDTEEGVTTNADAFAAISAGLTNGMDEEDFNTLLSDNGQSASEISVDRNSYTEDVISWLYDAARAEGDVTTLTDEDYYYVLRYCETQENDYAHTMVKSTLSSEAQNAWYEEVTSTLTATQQPAVGYANTNLTFYSTSSVS